MNILDSNMHLGSNKKKNSTELGKLALSTSRQTGLPLPEQWHLTTKELRGHMYL